jgi:hypothetical protein
MGCSPHDHLF